MTPADIAARAAEVSEWWTPERLRRCQLASYDAWGPTDSNPFDAIETLLADRERLRRLATADVVAFLMGERELDGCWFSERPSDALGAFWWRSHLAELRAAVLDGGAR